MVRHRKNQLMSEVIGFLRETFYPFQPNSRKYKARDKIFQESFQQGE